jgi:undecaprenol kinase
VEDKRRNKNSFKKEIIYHRRTLSFSFKYAVRGIIRVLRSERSFRIQLIIAAVSITAGFLFHISSTEWLFILLIICMVLCLEVINTAFELIIDMVTIEYRKIAERVKDIAAGAVLIASIFAVAIGLIIFIPYLVELLQ